MGHSPRKRRGRHIHYTVVALGATPLLALYAENRSAETINKLDALLGGSGEWAMTFLLLCLAITPTRALACRACRQLRVKFGKRLSDWNWLVALRRSLGLWCFFYALIHVWVYVWFEQGGAWDWILEDILSKPFLSVGVVTFIALLPMAITSNDRAILYLKRRWKIIHRLIYFCGVGALAHVVLLQKEQEAGYQVYLAVLLSIGVIRLYTGIIKSAYAHDDGFESSRTQDRTGSSSPMSAEQQQATGLDLEKIEARPIKF